MSRRKICVVTSSRADYGLLFNLIQLINKDKDLVLQLVVTGSHLSHKFGYTVKEIEEDDIPIKRRVKIIGATDSAAATVKSMGVAMVAFSKIFEELKPDLLIILGDRFEILAAASSALIFKIPVGHISGGEVTIGAIDDSIRHAITKMSWWHFVSTKSFKNRVVQLGEDPRRVFITGGIGLDMIAMSKNLSKNIIENNFHIQFGKKNILVNFHPETLSKNSIKSDFSVLLRAIDKLKDTSIFFTSPNQDEGGAVVSEMIKSFVKGQPDRFFIKSLGKRFYISFIQKMDYVIGNSSSGLTEVPTLKVPSINLGDRQTRRLKAKSVVDAKLNVQDIISAIKKVNSKEFQRNLSLVKNPLGTVGATKKIFKIIKDKDLPPNLQKSFKDLKRR